MKNISMKFISKSSNLLIVLRPGIQGSHITGALPIPMISAKFKDGLFDTDDQKMIDMLIGHPGFGSDFVSAEDTAGIDPFAYLRAPSEPEHLTTVIRNGQPIGSGKPAKINFPPEIKQALQEQALEMAKAMAPQLAQAMLKQALADHEASKAEVAPVAETAKKQTKKK